MISEKVLQYMCFDAKETTGGASSRDDYGNSNWPVSNIDQWLNSDAAAGQWWSARHSYDNAPNNSNVYDNYNEYDAKAGFLNGFSSNFKEALQEANIPYKCPPNEGGTTSDVVRRVFLASGEEIGINVNSEGSIIAYFNGGIAGAKPTEQAVANSEYQNSTYVNVSNYARYWLRSYSSSNSNYRLSVQTNSAGAGLVYNEYNNAYIGDIYGVRPLVNLPSTIFVSDEADAEGVYTIIWNIAPEIDGTDGSLGVKNITPFNIEYSVSDVNNDSVGITIKLNDNTIYTENNIDLETAKAISITRSMLENYGVEGTNTLTIQANDGKVTTTRTYTFIRNQTQIEIKGVNILSKATKPTSILLKTVATVPVGATMTVFVCNNANDDNPTWENCTTAVNNGTRYVFTNSVKTATNWGINVKVVIQKGTATDLAILKGFGGVI